VVLIKKKKFKKLNYCIYIFMGNYSIFIIKLKQIMSDF